MLSGKPDPSLGLAQLEREINTYRQELNSSPRWHFRENYIDRGVLDPFYTIEFNSQLEDAGDDLYHAPLFTTPYPYLRGVCLTREQPANEPTYWKKIARDKLVQRLERFLKMFREDYLQPPGAKGDLYSPQHQHELFKEKRFLFEIRSPRRSIIGVGPKMYAGLGIGAIRGQVTGDNNQPLANAIVELVAGEKTIARITNQGGLFWFSRVPPGKHRIRVRARSCIVQVIEETYFGNVKGWLADQDGNPVENYEVQLIAPDAEVFTGFSNASGKFTTGPLPAFPYILRIPDHLFSLEKSIYVHDAIIGGVLKAQDGTAFPNQKIVLKKGDKTVKEIQSDSKGRFLFEGLAGGRYRIQVPGQQIYVREISGGSVAGRSTGATGKTELFLVATDSTIGIERTNRSGEFSFDNVVPGKYRVGIN